MDGSADLKWRSHEFSSSDPSIGDSSTVGRSLDVDRHRRIDVAFANLDHIDPDLSPARESRSIDYNYATDKRTVAVPEYDYAGGGKKVLETILGMCWRLHYLRCSEVKDKGNPCCKLGSKPNSNQANANPENTLRWIY